MVEFVASLCQKDEDRFYYSALSLSRSLNFNNNSPPHTHTKSIIASQAHLKKKDWVVVVITAILILTTNYSNILSIRWKRWLPPLFLRHHHHHHLLSLLNHHYVITMPSHSIPSPFSSSFSPKKKSTLIRPIIPPIHLLSLRYKFAHAHIYMIHVGDTIKGKRRRVAYIFVNETGSSRV